MSLFKKLTDLFSAEKSATPASSDFVAVEYQGFTIQPEPLEEQGGFRINGVIEKEGNSHRFVRADVLMSAEQCAEEMVRKAKVMIDQQGDQIF